MNTMSGYINEVKWKGNSVWISGSSESENNLLHVKCGLKSVGNSFDSRYNIINVKANKGMVTLLENMVSNLKNVFCLFMT